MTRFSSDRPNFENSLCQGMVFRLKGDIPFESDDYHVFVVLNYNPQNGDILYLCNGTSQKEKRWKHIEDVYGINAWETTVILFAGAYSFITKDTLFDCNSIHKINIDDLDFNSNNIKMIHSEILSKDDISKIIQATLASPRVERYIKKSISPNYNK